jgi:cullin 2
MSIILGFNTNLKLTVKELQETTQLPDKELIRQVQSLLESKLIVIAADSCVSSSSSTTSNPENINENTVLSLNMDYSNKRTKFKINAAVQKETPQVKFLLNLRHLLLNHS